MVRINDFLYMMNPDIRPLERPLIHPNCQDELRSLYHDRGQMLVLKTQTKKRMGFQQENPSDFWKKSDWFESLGVSKGITLYAIRYNKIGDLGNLRVIFTIYKGKPILLHAFQEKSAKKDYQHAMEIAIERWEETENK